MKNFFRFYSNNIPRSVIVAQYSEGMLKIAVSRCSKKDNFIRKKGRAIAEGRLQKGKIYAKVNMPECTTKEFVEIAKNISNQLATDFVVCKENC